MATACADHVASFDAVSRQFVENNFGRVDVSRDGGDAQGWQRQKARLNDGTATWQKVNT